MNKILFEFLIQGEISDEIKEFLLYDLEHIYLGDEIKQIRLVDDDCKML